ncbi:DUF2840 domain-containing protein [Sphingomonas sp. CJ20]
MNDAPPRACPASAIRLRGQGSRLAGTTSVELTWIEQATERWIRFGAPVREQILDRRRCVLSFACGSVFAFVRWASNDYGTQLSRLDIVRAVGPGEGYSTLPCVSPGGELLLHLGGWPKVRQALAIIDAVEASGIDPCDVAPDYWRHVHNRLVVGLRPRAYAPARHRAWLLRRELGA